MRLVVAAVVGGVVMFGMHYYVWRRLVRDTSLPTRWRRGLTALMIVLGVSFPVARIASRTGVTELASWLGWPAFLWIAPLGLAFTLLVLVDCGRLLGLGVRKTVRRSVAPCAPSRREFVNRVFGGGVALSASALTGNGVCEALKPPRIVDVPITLSRLPAALDGFTCVQISDLHIGNTIGRDFVERLVARTNTVGGDLIAITGDLVDGPCQRLREAAAPLAGLTARHGVFYVTGNHEYYAGVEPWMEYLPQLGIRVLRNERVSVGTEAASFDLAGIDDHEAARFGGGHGPDLARAVQGRDPERELVLLAHQPKQVHDARRHGVGLQLSGHTHGGQIWPWHYAAMAQQGGLLAGWSRHGETQLYVSRGAGYWGPPVRVFAPAEITRVVLRAPAQVG